jgi:integral membrane protein
VTTAPQPPIAGALIRYRVMAFVVGVALLALCTGMVLKYVTHTVTSVTYLAMAHGWLFMLYVLLALDLCLRMRWSFGRIIFVVIAGTIPFLSFVAERKVVGWVHTDRPDAATSA